MKTIIVNFYGGPGTGKSSMTASTFAELKWQGINCEMALEFAKDVVWEESYSILENQLYIFGQQYHRIHRLNEKVDVILCDSPMIMQLPYAKQTLKNSLYVPFRELVLSAHKELNTLNIFLERVKPYETAGRMQTHDEAKKIDNEILDLLNTVEIPYITFHAHKESVKSICDVIMRRIDSDVCTVD